MPIVEVHSLSPKDPSTIRKMIADIRLGGATALNCPPSNIWVVFSALDESLYATEDEAQSNASSPPHPPVVIVKAQAGRSLEMKTVFATSIANAVGTALEIPPEQVWIHFEDLKPQDIWFEGKWLKEVI